MCGVSLNDRLRNEVIPKHCGLNGHVVTKIERTMLRWFGHVERMSESCLTKGIYKAHVSGNTRRRRPTRTYIDLTDEVIQKGQVRNTHNRRACMIRCLNVDEARGVCEDRSRWRSVVSAYPHRRKA